MAVDFGASDVFRFNANMAIMNIGSVGESAGTVSIVDTISKRCYLGLAYMHNK